MWFPPWWDSACTTSHCTQADSVCAPEAFRHHENMTVVSVVQLEMVQGGHNKFYRLLQGTRSDGQTLVVTHWGARGTLGQSKAQAFTSAIAAERSLATQQQSKERKGYARVVHSHAFSVPTTELDGPTTGVGARLRETFPREYHSGVWKTRLAELHKHAPDPPEVTVLLSAPQAESAAWQWSKEATDILRGSPCAPHPTSDHWALSVSRNTAAWLETYWRGSPHRGSRPVRQLSQQPASVVVLETWMGLWSPTDAASMTSAAEALEAAQLLVG